MSEDFRPAELGPIRPPADEAPIDVAACIREARERLVSQPQTDAASGRLVPGNAGPAGVDIIGHRSAQMQTALAPVRDAIEQGIRADLGYPVGGAERPPVRLRMVARNLATLDVLAETFGTWIEDRGVMTAKGKTRSAVTTLLSIIDRQNKLALALGLARRDKNITQMSAAEWAARQVSGLDDPNVTTSSQPLTWDDRVGGPQERTEPSTHE